MGAGVIEKIIKEHLINKDKKKFLCIPGEEIAIKIDHTLTQDATGTMVYLALQAVGIKRLKTEISVSYFDHNVLEINPENSDDYLFLKSVARKYGIIFSPHGNGICHQLHLDFFSAPGKTLLGSDSHTPTCGAVGMLCFGAGGLDVASALCGYPYYFRMPKIVRVNLLGKLKKFVSAKDLILELLRKYKVDGGLGKAFEYTGGNLNVYERAIVTNMGTELGLTTSIFPSDEKVYEFLKKRGGKKRFKLILPDKDAFYHETINIELDKLVPLIACPHSPDNVKTVKELEGLKIEQVCIGSCTNSSWYDLYLVAEILKDKKIHKDVELIITPGSREVLINLIKYGLYNYFLSRGVRVLEPGCGPCIGMGCVPSDKSVSLRTYNRNFPGRCGNKNANVYLCSTETAIASAVYGELTDPRKFKKKIRWFIPTTSVQRHKDFFIMEKNKLQKIFLSDNIKSLPKYEPLKDELYLKVLIKLGDDVSTDDIIPATPQTLKYRSNIYKLSEFVFSKISPDIYKRALENRETAIIASKNYGQGSSREHAAATLRYIGIKIVIAKSFSRIHFNNLINFGILPLEFIDENDYDLIQETDFIHITDVFSGLTKGEINANIEGKRVIKLKCELSQRERDIIRSGSFLNYLKCLKH